MIYFIADTHFNHKNIICYCNRPFTSVEDMNETLISNWNSVVGEDDIVYHLGDVILGNEQDIKSILPRLNGKKYLIKGNHDGRTKGFYEMAGFKVLGTISLLPEYKLVLSHTPVQDIIDGFTNIHGHIHDTPLHPSFDKDKHICVSVETIDYKPISINDILEIINKKGE